jgi:hypothetical protein
MPGVVTGEQLGDSVRHLVSCLVSHTVDSHDEFVRPLRLIAAGKTGDHRGTGGTTVPGIGGLAASCCARSFVEDVLFTQHSSWKRDERPLNQHCRAAGAFGSGLTVSLFDICGLNSPREENVTIDELNHLCRLIERPTRCSRPHPPPAPDPTQNCGHSTDPPAQQIRPSQRRRRVACRMAAGK